MARWNTLTVQTGWDGLMFASNHADTDVIRQFPRTLGSKGTLLAVGIGHSQEFDDLLAKATAAPDHETKTGYTRQLQKMAIDQNAWFTPVLVTVGMAAKNPKIHGDGIYEIETTEWTPEDTWLDA